MFGRNKANQEELQRTKDQLDKLVREYAGKRMAYEAGTADIANSSKQLQVNMKQVDENSLSTISLAKQNSGQEAWLAEEVRQLSEKMETSEKEYDRIVTQIHEQTEECMALVEGNKHFTTPSKCINETPGTLEGFSKTFRELIVRLDEKSKQIGVGALNAAIEAGRLGEPGKQFVDAAEEVHRFAGEFGGVITEMRTLLDQSDEKLKEMGEQSHRLVGLLKDSNVATGKLYKKSQATEEMIRSSSIRPYSGDVSGWKEHLVGIRNTEDEILKLQERSRIQMEDIQMEIEAQEKAQKEISDELQPAFRHAKEYIDSVK